MVFASGFEHLVFRALPVPLRFFVFSTHCTRVWCRRVPQIYYVVAVTTRLFSEQRSGPQPDSQRAPPTVIVWTKGGLLSSKMVVYPSLSKATDRQWFEMPLDVGLDSSTMWQLVTMYVPVRVIGIIWGIWVLPFCVSVMG